jgi:hypothetical protein
MIAFWMVWAGREMFRGEARQGRGQLVSVFLGGVGQTSELGDFSIFFVKKYIAHYIFSIINDPVPPQSLLEQMAQIPQLERSKLCVVRQGPDGPYYNHQTWKKGRNVSRYVPRDQVLALENAIDGYHRY